MPGHGNDAERRPPTRTRARTNKRVSNQRLREELGWNPIFPTFRHGYAAPRP
jgi:hypothetical protein